MQAIAFLDRDGTLNKEKNYLHKWDDFEWLPGAKDLIKGLKEKGYIVAIVTNQSGIARGYYTAEDVQILHKKLNEDLLNSHHVSIDHFQLCPHHPEFSGKCSCRKPGTEMLENVIQKYTSFDKENSFILGDKEIDLQAGERLGIKGYLAPFGYSKTYVDRVADECIVSSYKNLLENL